MPAAQRNAIDRIAMTVSILGLAAIAFAVGVAVGVYQLFPYAILSEAAAAARSLVEVERQRNFFVYDLKLPKDAETGAGGVTVYDQERAAPGYTFLVGFDGEAYGARLLAADGTVVHRWTKGFSEVFPDPTHVEYSADDSVIDWHGTWLFENGDVLLNFTGGNFPYGGGLAKIDQDSNVLWSLPRNTHHDINVAEDGTIFAVSHIYRKGVPEGLSKTQKGFHDDTILEIAPDGTLLSELSVLQAIRESEFRGLLSLNYRDREDIRAEDEQVGDPFHVNNVEVLSSADAAKFPMFEAGDLLVSLRNVNTIGVISRKTRVLKWALTGPFVRQHDPDFTPNGTILVYDNRGHDGPGGRSRLIEIDPATQRIVWSYTGSAARPFYAYDRGKQSLLPNGNILAIESAAGRVFEVTREGKIVWEYFNMIDTARGEPVSNKVGRITEAVRIPADAVTFLD